VATARSYGDPCGVARSLDVVGERWALLVVRELLLGPKRFADLRAGLPTMSPNVLSQRLRELDERGVVRRRVLGPPLRVHVYELTEWGRELEPVLLHLGRWGALAPLPEGGRLGVDSMMLSIKAAYDPMSEGVHQEAYEIRIDDETFTAEVANGRLDLRRGHVEHPAATATATAESLRTIISGQVAIADAVHDGTLVLAGSPTSVQHLSELLAAAAQ
jgi:DNA-binding HxlR family transcriptional regulator